MARIDHIIARNQGAERKPRVFRVRHTKKILRVTKARHEPGSPWWRKQAAELAELRQAIAKAKRKAAPRVPQTGPNRVNHIFAAREA